MRIHLKREETECHFAELQKPFAEAKMGMCCCCSGLPSHPIPSDDDHHDRDDGVLREQETKDNRCLAHASVASSTCRPRYQGWGWG